MRNRSHPLVATVAAFLLCGMSLLAQEKKASAPEPAQKPVKAAVQLEGKTIFFVQERVYAFSPEERARAISEKLDRLARDPFWRADKITVASEGDSTTEVVAGDVVIMAITERDALAAGKPRTELAEIYAQSIREAIAAAQQEYGLRNILLGIFYTLLATSALILILRAMHWAFPRIYRLLDQWRETIIPSIRIQRLELLSAHRIASLLIGAARVARLMATVALLYFYFPLVLSFFPWTRGYSQTLLDYVLSPLRSIWEATTAFLPDAFTIGVILLIAFYVIKLVKFVFAELGKGTLSLPGFYPDWADPTYKIVRFLLLVFTAIVVFPYMPGSKSPAFQGVSIFVGLLVSLGSSSAISNIISGVMLTYTRAFQLGDRVCIGETVGDVTEKTLLVTRVRTIKNVDIAIPNAMVLSSHIVNYSSSAAQHGLILHTSVTIGYDAPWRTVHQLLLGAAAETPDILDDPKPFVLQTALNDFFVTYEINAFTGKPGLMARTYSELHQKIQDKFNEAGVEIMSPHYSSLRDGNSTTIPAEHRPADYKAPGFRVSSTDASGKPPRE